MKKETVKNIAQAAIAVLAISAAIVYAQTRPGAVTTVTYDGAEITLNQDSTWTSRGALTATGSGDVFIPLGGARGILWLKSDNTYTFTKTMPTNVSNRPREFPTIGATSTFTHTEYDVANRKALDDVYNKGVSQLRQFLPANAQKTAAQKAAHKKAQDFLMACLKDEYKENEVEQTFGQIKGGQWKVDAKLQVPNYRVEKVIRCLDYQLQPEE